MDRVQRDKHDEFKETLGKKILSNLLSLLKIFLVCFVLVFLTANYVVRPIRISGDSMVPTLSQGEFGFSNAFQARFMEITYGDIVVAYEKNIFHNYIVKRVIALPGDTIYCKDEVVYVNDQPIDEPYLENDFAENIQNTSSSLIFNEDFEKHTLGEDEYWLMGDNRINSTDSRMFGAVNRSQIKGIGITVVLPMKRVRTVE